MLNPKGRNPVLGNPFPLIAAALEFPVGQANCHDYLLHSTDDQLI